MFNRVHISVKGVYKLNSWLTYESVYISHDFGGLVIFNLSGRQGYCMVLGSADFSA